MKIVFSLLVSLMCRVYQKELSLIFIKIILFYITQDIAAEDCAVNECYDGQTCRETAKYENSEVGLDTFCRNSDGTCDTLYTNSKLCFHETDVKHACLDTSSEQIDFKSQCQHIVTGECIPASIIENGLQRQNIFCRNHTDVGRAFLTVSTNKWNKRVTDKIYVPFTYRVVYICFSKNFGIKHICGFV